MDGLRGIVTLVRTLVDFLYDPFDEPSFVGDRHVDRLLPHEPSVVHQKEGGFKDELFSIFRLKAKES